MGRKSALKRQQSGRFDKQPKRTKDNSTRVAPLYPEWAVPGAGSFSDPQSRWFAIAFGVLALAIYASTAHRGTAGGDAGELVVVANTGGIAHPPGYPLFSIIGRIFSFLPLGNPAFRVNLVSSVFDALAGALLLMAAAKWTRNLWCGVAAAAVFCFSPLVWTYSSAAEVFSINNFFAAGLLYLTILFDKCPSFRLACWMAFGTGLGIANHQTLVFFALPLAMWAIIRDPRATVGFRQFAWFIGLFALGLSTYLYLFIAAHKIPLMGWGDTSTLDGLKAHILREDYGTFRLGNDQIGDESVFHRIWIYLSSLPRELAYAGVLLAPLGIYHVLRAGRRTSLATAWAFAYVFYNLVFQWLNNVRLDDALLSAVQARFNQMSNLLLAVAIAWGLLAIMVYARSAAKWVLAVAAVALLVFQVAVNYARQDQSGNMALNDFGKSVLNSLPANALLLTRGDHVIGTLRYLQMIEGVRTDIAVIDESLLAYRWSPRWVAKNFPDLKLPKNGIYSADGYLMKDFFEANLDVRPIFVINGIQPWDQSYSKDFSFWAYGLCRWVLPRNKEPMFDQWIDSNRKAFASFDSKGIQHFAPETWEAVVRDNYWKGLRRYGAQLIMVAGDKKGDRGLMTEAVQILQNVASNDPVLDPTVYRDLGIGYQRLANDDPSATTGMMAAWRKYLELHPGDDAETAAIRNEMAAAERRLAGAPTAPDAH